MTNWQRRRIGEVVVKWVKGGTPGRSHKKFFSDTSGIPWVRVGDLKDGVLTKTETCLTREGADRINDLANEGTVLLSVSGTIGKVAIAGTDVMMNQAVRGLRFDPQQIIPEYAYYYFQFFRPWLQTMANTVTISNLTKNRLENISIVFPCTEEQQFIVNLLQRAEMLIKRQNIGSEVDNILYSALHRQLNLPLNREHMRCLSEYLSAPVLVGPAVKGDGNDVVMDHEFINPGDLLIRRYKGDPHDNYLLVESDREIVWNSRFFRVRVAGKKLRPEFLLVWLKYSQEYLKRDIYGPDYTADVAAVSNFLIPKISLEIQDRLVPVVRRVCRIRHQLEAYGEKLDTFYQSMLARAFTGKLSGRFRTQRQLEEPDMELLQRHYHVRDLESFVSEDVGAVDWNDIFNARQMFLLDHLSPFQKDILQAYAKAGAPLPVHSVFKNIGKNRKRRYNGYSIQDALAAVKMFEGLGILEGTVPEKIYVNGSEITDSRSRPITIHKYQASYKNQE